MIICPDELLRKGPGRWNDVDVSGAFRESWQAFKGALENPLVVTAGVVMGLPGAGKSTWCSQHDSAKCVLWDGVWQDPGRRSAMASMIRAAGKTPVAVMVVAGLEVAMARNSERPAWRRVPDKAILQAHARFQAAPPRRSEGWERLAFAVSA